MTKPKPTPQQMQQYYTVLNLRFLGLKTERLVVGGVENEEGGGLELEVLKE